MSPPANDDTEPLRTTAAATVVRVLFRLFVAGLCALAAMLVIAWLVVSYA